MLDYNVLVRLHADLANLKGLNSYNPSYGRSYAFAYPPARKAADSRNNYNVCYMARYYH